MMADEHWTTDEDLLGHFVLGKLPDARRQALELHLQSCPECRKRVDGERLLAAGVQRAGREDLKARLRERLGLSEGSRVAGEEEAHYDVKKAAYIRAAGSVRPDRPTVPPPRRRQNRAWVFAAATAACVVIVTGVGILNRWWAPQEPLLATSDQDVTGATAPSPEKGALANGTTGAGSQMARAEQGKLKKELGTESDAQIEAERFADRQEGKASAPTTAAAAAPSENMAGLEKQAAGKKDTRERMEEPVAAELRQKDVDDVARDRNAEESGRAQAANELERLQTADGLARAQSSGGAFMDQGTWVEGIASDVPRGIGANVEHPAYGKPDVLQPRGNRNHIDRKLEPIDATVTQRPLADAPPLQQQQRRLQAQTVLTNVIQTDSTLRLTLYPDSQLSDYALRQAQVYRVADDSLVVVLPGQLIRYRFQAPALQRAR
ncbi:MAG: zf-HC2 domain-containing protein [Bacteroidetes bacterium]|nr:zf-HC2 domain-containing protein [Bacteroidota bacterium]